MFLGVWSVVGHVVTLLVVIVRHLPPYCPAEYNSVSVSSLSSQQTPGHQHSQIKPRNTQKRREQNKVFTAIFTLIIM